MPTLLTLRPLRNTNRLVTLLLLLPPLDRLPSTTIRTDPNKGSSGIRNEAIDRAIQNAVQRLERKRRAIVQRVTPLTADVCVWDTANGEDNLGASGGDVTAADKVVVFALGVVSRAGVGEWGGELWAVGVFDAGYCWCGGDAD